jgi:hypothetical protein
MRIFGIDGGYGIIMRFHAILILLTDHLDGLAFYSIRELAELFRTRRIASVQLTEFSTGLERIIRRFSRRWINEPGIIVGWFDVKVVSINWIGIIHADLLWPKKPSSGI